MTHVSDERINHKLYGSDGAPSPERNALRYASLAVLTDRILAVLYLNALAYQARRPQFVRELAGIVLRATPESVTRRVYRWYASASRGVQDAVLNSLPFTSRCRELDPIEWGRSPDDPDPPPVVVRPVAWHVPDIDVVQAVERGVSARHAPSPDPDRDVDNQWLVRMCADDPLMLREVLYSVCVRERAKDPARRLVADPSTWAALEAIMVRERWPVPDPARPGTELLFRALHYAFVRSLDAIGAPSADAVRSWMTRVWAYVFAADGDGARRGVAARGEWDIAMHLDDAWAHVVEIVRVEDPSASALEDAFRCVIAYLCVEAVHLFECGKRLQPVPGETEAQRDVRSRAFHHIGAGRRLLFDAVVRYLRAHDDPATRGALRALRRAAAVGRLAWTDYAYEETRQVPERIRTALSGDVQVAAHTCRRSSLGPMQYFASLLSALRV
jgi:hypothetical protein